MASKRTLIANFILNSELIIDDLHQHIEINGLKIHLLIKQHQHLSKEGSEGQF